MNDKTRDQHSMVPAGNVLGVGVAGFFDGILLHQILQTHAILSAMEPLESMANMKSNM